MGFKTEVLYCFQLLQSGRLKVTKWDDSENTGKAPTDYYTIGNRGLGRCDCIGSSRNPYCKHRRMVDKVGVALKKFGLPMMGCYYDYDRDILYLPADGEGIPIEGSVNTWNAAIAQDRAY